MFLSPQITQLEADGSLIIDLADERGPRLRIGPLAEGMSWTRWEVDRWVGTDHDYGVTLVNQAHDTGRRDLPVLHYLAALPRPFVEALYPVRYVQATLLQLATRWRGARDLVTVNLPLAWLAAGAYAADPLSRHRIAGAFERPRKDLLATLLGQEVRPGQIKFLSRVVLDVGGRSAWVHLRRFIANEQAVMKFQHWPCIPTGLLGVFAEAPYLAGLEMLRTEVASTDNLYDLLRVVRQRRGLVLDTARMARIIRPTGGPARALTRCRSWARFKRLHDELNTAIHTLGWRALVDADIDPTREFGTPPIAGTPQFEPIRTVADLIEEGQTMRHCAATRAREVMDGRAAIYRVQLGSERATLEISVGPGREPLAIEQFKLKQNAEPTDAAWTAAEAWLVRGRETWAKRLAGE